MKFFRLLKGKTIISILRIIIDMIVFPFRSLKNFLKSIFILSLVAYVVASLFVIVDYLSREYGYIGKFTCSFAVKNNLDEKVVRIVGGYSEGSGFFINDNQNTSPSHMFIRI